MNLRHLKNAPFGTKCLSTAKKKDLTTERAEEIHKKIKRALMSKP